jgi:hypothetical protein
MSTLRRYSLYAQFAHHKMFITTIDSISEAIKFAKGYTQRYRQSYEAVLTIETWKLYDHEEKKYI